MNDGESRTTSVPPSSDEIAAVNPVDDALAFAIVEATKAGEWATVAQLARELEARRLASASVADLDDERKQRGAQS